VGVWLATALIVVAGCGRGGNLPRTVPARGTVTLDGKPIEAAQVVLVPDPEVPGAYGGFGASDASGSFSLRAFDAKDGVIPGNYKVQISKTLQTKLEGPAPSTLDGGDNVVYEFGVPGRYTGVETSGLKCTIPDNGITDLKFELTTK
jgi:hypothetical protein